MTRGAAGRVEASWSGAPGTTPWTGLLAPLAAAYGIAAGAARRRAAASRRSVPGMRVIAVGNLTVGGTGKSSLARWLAAEAAKRDRAAVLVRGYGGRGGPRPAVVPDFPGYPLAVAADRWGDEAAAHRAALPPEVAVVVDRDRRAAALLALEGYGATTAILDDGWEQGTLAWDELWVTLDPDRPAGNGRLLPAGPLRRRPETLREAQVIAFVLQSRGAEVPAGTLEWAARYAPEARVARLVRVLLDPLPPGPRRPAGLVTGVGAPERVAGFAEASGYSVVAQAPFPDHARVSPGRLREAMLHAARRGAEVILITEKDEHRWTLPSDPPLPVKVLRTGLCPLDPA